MWKNAFLKQTQINKNADKEKMVRYTRASKRKWENMFIEKQKMKEY